MRRIAGLARFQGWRLRSPEAPVCPAGLAHDSPEALHEWLEAAAAWLGVEAELVEVPYADVARLVCGAGPALLRLPGREKPSFLAILGRQRRRVLVARAGPGGPPGPRGGGVHGLLSRR